MFRDNKGSRAAQLENLFITTKLEKFANMGEYCQALKSIADQLGDVDNFVPQHRRVIQLVNGLTTDYDTVGTVIQQTNPLPSFDTARSMLLLEEQRRAQKKPSPSSTVLAAHAAPLQVFTPLFRPLTMSIIAPPNHNNRGGPGKGRGGRGGRNNGRGQHQLWNGFGRGQQQPTWNGWSPFGPPSHQQPWATPPCPYPTAAPSRPLPSTTGLLGPCPQQQPSFGRGQAFLAPQATDLSSAFNGLSLQPPDDTWYGHWCDISSHQ